MQTNQQTQNELQKKLQNIFINYVQSMNENETNPKLNDYKPELRLKRIHELNEQVINDFNRNLQKFIVELSSKRNELQGKINDIKYPEKNTFTHVKFEIEFQSAMMFANSLPEHWQRVIEKEFNDKRYSFVFKSLELLQASSYDFEGMSDAVELEKKFNSILGVTELVEQVAGIDEVVSDARLLFKPSDTAPEYLKWDYFTTPELELLYAGDANLYTKLRDERYNTSSVN